MSSELLLLVLFMFLLLGVLRWYYVVFHVVLFVACASSSVYIRFPIVLGVSKSWLPATGRQGGCVLSK